MEMNYLPLVMLRVEDQKKEQQIIQLCQRLGCRTKRLEDKDADTAVSVLAGINKAAAGSRPAEKAPAGYRLPELLIFSGFPEERLDEFLAEYKKAEIAPVGLKAVVTLHNLGWSVYQLAAELYRERMAILLNRKP